MNEKFMNEALLEAKAAAESGEIPVGAVIVKDGKIIARGRNRREEKKSVFSHAECEAIAEANKVLGDWRLENTSIYVTLEPCAMCLGAILNARIGEIIFGAYDLTAGAVDSKQSIYDFTKKPPKVFAGIKETACQTLLDEFFKDLRKEKP